MRILPNNFITEIRLIFNQFYLFFLLYIVFLITGGILQLFYSQRDILLWFNRMHTPQLNLLFKYITYFGDGIFAVIVALLFLFVNYRYTILLIIAFSTGGILSQVLKYYIDTPRPVLSMGTTSALNLVPGVEVLLHNSFPSGHTITAFTLFLLLSVIVKKSHFQLLFFTIALLVALSRVYLLLHFFVDIYFGSMIGIIIVLVYILLVRRIKFFGKINI